MSNKIKEKQEQEISYMFKELNIEKVEIDELNPEFQHEVKKAFVKISTDFPILDGYIKEVSVTDFNEDDM